MTWTPRIAHVERRVNVNKLTDTRLSPRERCATYDGESHLSCVVQVKGNRLPEQCKSICDSVAQHIQNVSAERYKVTGIVADLRIDPGGTLWFLAVSSLRIEDTGGAGPLTREEDQFAADGKLFESFTKSESRGRARLSDTVGNADNAKVVDTESSKDTNAEVQPFEQGLETKNVAMFKYIARCVRGEPGPMANSILKNLPPHPLPRDRHGMCKLMRAQCPSCGVPMKTNSFEHSHTVAYKTVAVHYDQLLKHLGLKPYPLVFEEERNALSQDLPPVEEDNRWPLMEETLRAVGGIGLFAVYAITVEEVEEVKKKKYMHPQYTPPRRIVRPVPPMIHLAEPHLGGNEYRSLRKEIEWLFKPMHVCESCFLVYSRIASDLIAGATPHHAVNAILGPRENPVVRQPFSKKDRMRTEMEHVRNERIQRNAELSRLKQALQRGMANKTRKDAELIVAKSRKLDERVKELEETPCFEWTPDLAKTAVSVMEREKLTLPDDDVGENDKHQFIEYPNSDPVPRAHGAVPPADHEVHPLHHLLHMQFEIARFDDDFRGGFVKGQMQTQAELEEKCKALEGTKGPVEIAAGYTLKNDPPESTRKTGKQDDVSNECEELVPWDNRLGPGTTNYVPEFVKTKLDSPPKQNGQDTNEKPDKAYPTEAPDSDAFRALEKRGKAKKKTSNPYSSSKQSFSKNSKFVPAPPITTTAYRRQRRTVGGGYQDTNSATNKSSKNLTALFSFTSPQNADIHPDIQTSDSDLWNVVSDQWKTMVENSAPQHEAEVDETLDDKSLLSNEKPLGGRRRRRRKDEQRKLILQNKASVDAYLEAEQLRKQAMNEVRELRLKEYEAETAQEEAREAARQARRKARDDKLRQEVMGTAKTEHDRRAKAFEVSEALQDADQALQNAKYQAGLNVGPGYTRPLGVGNSVKLAERKRKERIQKSRAGGSRVEGNKTAVSQVSIPDPPIGSGIFACGFKVDGQSRSLDQVPTETVSLIFEGEMPSQRTDFVSVRRCVFGEYQPNIDEKNACERSLLWLQQFGAGAGGPKGDSPDLPQYKLDSVGQNDPPGGSQATLLADVRNIRDVEVGWGRGMYVVECVNMKTGEVTRKYLSRWDLEDESLEDPIVASANQNVQRWNELLKSYGLDHEVVDSVVRRLPPAAGKKQERVLLPPREPDRGWGQFIHNLEAEEWRKLHRDSRCIWNDDEVCKIKVEKVKRSIDILNQYRLSMNEGHTIAPKKDSESRSEISKEDVEFATKVLSLDREDGLHGRRLPPRALEDGQPPAPLKELTNNSDRFGCWFTDVSASLGYTPAVPNTIQGIIAWGIYRGKPSGIFLMWLRGHPHCHPYKGKPFTLHCYSFTDGLATLQRYSYVEILEHPALRACSRLRIAAQKFCSKSILNLPVKEHQPDRRNISQPFVTPILDMFTPDAPKSRYHHYQFKRGLLANMLSEENDKTSELRYYCMEATDAQRPVVYIRKHDISVSSVDRYPLRRHELEEPSTNPFVWESAKTLSENFKSKTSKEVLLAAKIHMLGDDWYLVTLRMIPPMELPRDNTTNEAMEDPNPEEVKADHSRSADPRNKVDSEEVKQRAKHIPRYRLVVVRLDTAGPWERHGYTPFPGDTDGGDAGNEELVNVRERILSYFEARETRLNPLLEHAQSIETERDVSDELKRHLCRLMEGDEDHVNEQVLEGVMNKSDDLFRRELGFREDQAGNRH